MPKIPAVNIKKIPLQISKKLSKKLNNGKLCNVIDYRSYQRTFESNFIGFQKH